MSGEYNVVSGALCVPLFYLVSLPRWLEVGRTVQTPKPPVLFSLRLDAHGVGIHIAAMQWPRQCIRAAQSTTRLGHKPTCGVRVRVHGRHMTVTERTETRPAPGGSKRCAGDVWDGDRQVIVSWELTLAHAIPW